MSEQDVAVRDRGSRTEECEELKLTVCLGFGKRIDWVQYSKKSGNAPS